MTREIMRCMLDSSSRMSFDGMPTQSVISLAAWRAHADAGCSPTGMIAVCFESRSAESCGMHCWQTESCMVQGPRQSPIPSRQGDRLASTISDPGERLSLIRVQTAKWSCIV